MAIGHVIALLEFFYNAVVHYAQTAQGQAELVSLEALFGMVNPPVTPTPTAPGSSTQTATPESQVVIAR